MKLNRVEQKNKAKKNKNREQTLSGIKMYLLRVKGVVQGVGFRPFIYRLATSMGLKGYVKNTGDGMVEILIDRDVEEFIHRMKKEKPPISQIHEISVRKIDGKKIKTNFRPDSFHIEKSGGQSGELSLPPPDVAICDRCLEEIFDENDRRYRYSFTSCTDCGARFSVAVRLPYDRENTTFSEFPLCKDCTKEYENISDRRYYAQSIACPMCGPEYTLLSSKKEVVGKGYPAIQKTAHLLDSGKYIAIKGIGGYHIACITEDDVVKGLRELLRRVQQPFAIMVRNEDVLKEIAHVSEEEMKEMRSYVKPITILRKKNEFFEVSPHLNTLGIMLPYTPLHHLLFENLRSDFLVMTSANLPGEPMFIDDGVFELPVDFVLKHNLRLYNRVDDSVVKFINGRKMIIRRSRGYVPISFKLDSPLTSISVGAELYNSVCFLKDKQVIQSQYIGNTSNFRTFNEFFKKAIDFFSSFLKMERVDVIFCDLHPQYNTTIFAEKLSRSIKARLIRVQHHFAHGFSVMAERELNRAIAISVDGVGYGFDGKVWGGEVLLIDLEDMNFKRLGRLEEFKLLGGDLAGKYPLRVLFSLIYEHTGDYEMLKGYEKYLRKGESFEVFEMQFNKDISTIRSTSTGRMMDAISSMLEICMERTYEGEPAMKLEAVAEFVDGHVSEPEIEKVREPSIFPPYVEEGFGTKKGEVEVVKTKKLVSELLERYIAGENKKTIAGEFITYIAKGLSSIAGKYADRYNVPVVLSGGVAYNTIFTTVIERELLKRNLKLYTNEITASGDNGISFGQIYLSKFLE